MTRQAKTPRQRAEEALAVAERSVARLGKTKAALQDHLQAVTREHDAAIARRDHLKQHPDLHPTNRPGDDA
ncbi:MAG TPA: hypothetical protein VGE43_08375 [Acidimicrobiales bacterium]